MLQNDAYHLLFVNNPQPMWFFDQDSLAFLDVNEAAIELYGYSRDQFLSMTILDIRTKEDAQRLSPQLTEPKRGRSLWGIWKHQKADGSLIDVEVTGYEVKYGDHRARLINVKDLTEQFRAQRALQESEERLRQSQKMEAIGLLAAGIAHDFNNMLAVIMMYSESIIEELGPVDSVVNHSANAIRETAERSASLTRQLLAFSRRQVLESKTIQLNELVSKSINFVSRLIGEKIQIKSRFDSSIGLLKVDPTQLEQVILNLSVNARDAMPEGGILTFETHRTQLFETEGSANLGLAPGPYIVLEVADTGCGMDAETQKRIFEPFFTTKEQGRGTGLGLSTVFGIVKQSHGEILIESKPGEGTRFRIFFPEYQGPIESVVAKSSSVNAIQGHETILVIEDEELLRPILCDALRRSGYSVLEASNGETAISLFHNHASPIHLLISDIMMPGISGPELVKKLNLDSSLTQVLFLSGYLPSSIPKLDLNSVSFLEKPFNTKFFLSKIRDILDKMK